VARAAAMVRPARAPAWLAQQAGAVAAAEAVTATAVASAVPLAAAQMWASAAPEAWRSLPLPAEREESAPQSKLVITAVPPSPLPAAAEAPQPVPGRLPQRAPAVAARNCHPSQIARHLIWTAAVLGSFHLGVVYLTTDAMTSGCRGGRCRRSRPLLFDNHGVGRLLPPRFVQELVQSGVREEARQAGVVIDLISDPMWR
jgi:hypothetical protein